MFCKFRVTMDRLVVKVRLRVFRQTSSAMKRQLHEFSDENRTKNWQTVNHNYDHSRKTRQSNRFMLELAILTFIFTNLLLTLLFRAISEELYYKGSETKWIQERCQVTQNESEIFDFWPLSDHQWNSSMGILKQSWKSAFTRYTSFDTPPRPNDHGSPFKSSTSTELCWRISSRPIHSTSCSVLQSRLGRSRRAMGVQIRHGQLVQIRIRGGGLWRVRLPWRSLHPQRILWVRIHSRTDQRRATEKSQLLWKFISVQFLSFWL